MKTRSKINYQNLAIIFIAILLAFSTFMNITLAYFTDSKTAMSSSGTLQFGYISLKPEIKEQPTTNVDGNTVSFTISATEVAGDKAYRTLALNNTTNKKTEDFYLRVKFEFINNNATSTLASANIASDNSYWQNTNSDYKNQVASFTSPFWSLGSDGKYYYNSKVVMSDGNTLLSQYIPIEITFTSGLTQETINNAYVKITLEAIQCANNGYEAWQSTAPSGWPSIAGGNNWPS